MASSLRHGFIKARSPLLSRTRWFSSSQSQAVVETKIPDVGIISGIPEQHLKRRVVIYSPARTASQQGSGKVGKWKINFLSTQKWENPLMGWTSTGDPYANVGDAALSFDSEQAAKEFAEKHGWDYTNIVLHQSAIFVGVCIVVGYIAKGSVSNCCAGQEASHTTSKGQDLCRQLQVEGAAKERGEVNCVLSRSQSS
ncbi:hypothetical protein ACLB2K_009928 [Fragaria x ananassa]